MTVRIHKMTFECDNSGTATPSLWQSTWTTPIVLVALLTLLVWRSVTFVQEDWLASLPRWILFVFTGVIPHLFLLIYPLATCRQQQPVVFRLPRLKRLLTEALVAAPIILGCLVLLAIAQLAVVTFFPEYNLVPEAYDRMSGSGGSPFVYGLLIASIAYAPISEEVFFRGFLFNAFRKRIPVVPAVLLTAVVFGFGHFYGLIQSVVAALLGLLLTLVYVWRRTIIAPIFVHGGYNALAAAGVLFAMYANANAPVLGIASQEDAEKCVIAVVVPGSPAESAGLLPGDTIIGFNEYAITGFQDLLAAVSYCRAGDSAVVWYTRNGETRHVTVVLAPGSEF